MTRAAGRSAALRKADAVIAWRAAQIRQRENTLRDALTEYFCARDSADGVRADAEKAAARLRREADDRVAQVQERAERRAAGFEQQAQAAVRRMLELGESRQAIAQAAGLTPAQVRDAQRVAPPLAERYRPSQRRLGSVIGSANRQVRDGRWPQDLTARLGRLAV